MNILGYRVNVDKFQINRRFNGLKIHLYNNHNGRYGFIEFGKDIENSFLHDLDQMDLETIVRFLVKEMLNEDESCKNNALDYTSKKYDLAYILGLSELKKERMQAMADGCIMACGIHARVNMFKDSCDVDIKAIFDEIGISKKEWNNSECEIEKENILLAFDGDMGWLK